MVKDIIPYEQALALKQLGFDEPCFGLFVRTNNKLLIKEVPNQQESEQYFGGILAPTYSQAFRFFREKYRLQPSVNSFCFEEYSFVIMGSRNEILYPIHHNLKSIMTRLLNDGKKNPWEFDTYEEAELACLIKLIEIVKQ
jgi:hypothetical protein